MRSYIKRNSEKVISFNIFSNDRENMKRNFREIRPRIFPIAYRLMGSFENEMSVAENAAATSIHSIFQYVHLKNKIRNPGYLNTFEKLEIVNFYA